MGIETHVIVAGAYNALEDALDDFDALPVVARGGRGEVDAVVITHRVDGRVKVVRHRAQEPTRSAHVEAGKSLALGVVVALFPAVGIGSGLVAGTAAGPGLGALAGHITAGLSREDLRTLGQLLDVGHSGLVVVTDGETEEDVLDAVQNSQRRDSRRLQSDRLELEELLRAATTPPAVAPGPSESPGRRMAGGR